MRKNEVVIPEGVIANKIMLIRGQKVMLDSDLAELYGVETKRLNEQVKRNVNRFPVPIAIGNVSTKQRRMERLEVAFCDLKLGRAKKRTSCIY